MLANIFFLRNKTIWLLKLLNLGCAVVHVFLYFGLVSLINIMTTRDCYPLVMGGLLSLVSDITPDRLPRAGTAQEELGSPTSIIKQNKTKVSETRC